MDSEPLTTIQVSRCFSVPPERVFDAWLDVSTAGEWLFATPSGRMVRTEIDGRVGGAFVLVDRRNGDDVAHTGTFVEVDRPRRLVFTLCVPKYSPQVTRVTVEVAPQGPGCEVVLTHGGVLESYATRTEAGWGEILAALDRTLAAR